MSKKSVYDRVGSLDVYKKRPQKDDDYEWIIIAVMVLGALFLIGQCVG